VDVDGFSFAGLVRADGAPVKDLNDFAHIDPDYWEAERDAIEEAFSLRDPKGRRQNTERDATATE
jgi:hypothetical protein